MCTCVCRSLKKGTNKLFIGMLQNFSPLASPFLSLLHCTQRERERERHLELCVSHKSENFGVMQIIIWSEKKHPRRERRERKREREKRERERECVCVCVCFCVSTLLFSCITSGLKNMTSKLDGRDPQK